MSSYDGVPALSHYDSALPGATHDGIPATPVMLGRYGGNMASYVRQGRRIRGSAEHVRMCQNSNNQELQNLRKPVEMTRPLKKNSNSSSQRGLAQENHHNAVE